MKTCLLDLNYTLVANSNEKASPFLRQIERETYRTELIDALKKAGCRVILITARPAQYSKATLHSIEDKTGWSPDKAFFNDQNLPPPSFKELVLTGHLLPGTPASDLFAVESNPATRAMYARHGVRAMTYSTFLEVK